MSDDYAALLTTLIVAVLAVGTLQAYTLMRRLGQEQTGAMSDAINAQHRVLQAMQQGQAPAAQDLLEARAPVPTAMGFPRSAITAYITGIAWTVVVIVLGAKQIQILMWAGSAARPKDPELARSSFYLVSTAIGLLLGEGILRALTETFVEQRASTAPVRQYSRSERKQMRSAVRQFRRTGQVPTPPNPPSP